MAMQLNQLNKYDYSTLPPNIEEIIRTRGRRVNMVVIAKQNGATPENWVIMAIPEGQVFFMDQIEISTDQATPTAFYLYDENNTATDVGTDNKLVSYPFQAAWVSNGFQPLKNVPFMKGIQASKSNQVADKTYILNISGIMVDV